MNKKFKLATVTLGALALLSGGTIVGYAASDWGGHANILAINDNLDKLAGKLSQNQTALADAQQALKQAQNGQDALKAQLVQAQQQYDALNTQKNNDTASFNQQLQEKQQEIQGKIAEINQKIQEGNDKVAAKQAEVDSKNKTIDDLNKQLSDQKTASDADMAQAIKDAQDTRTKSDQIVNQYVGK